MADLKAQAMRTLGRLREERARVREEWDLTDEDFELLISVTENLVSKLSAEERIRFQHVFGGYVIGNTLVSETIGLKYIQYLLQEGVLSCLHLTAGSPLPPGVTSAEGKEAAAMAVISYDDDHMEDIGDIPPNVTDAEGVFDPYDSTTDEPLGLLMDGKYMRAIRYRMQQLRKSGNDPEELEYLEKYFATNTFHGRSKQHVNEKERARQSVCKAIKKAINKLIENPDTQDIGLHLRDNIKFGHDCQYVGTWTWKF